MAQKYQVSKKLIREMASDISNRIRNEKFRDEEEDQQSRKVLENNMPKQILEGCKKLDEADSYFKKAAAQLDEDEQKKNVNNFKKKIQKIREEIIEFYNIVD